MKASIDKITYKNSGKLIAYVDVLIGDTLTVKGFKIMDGENGRFLAAPSIKGKEDKWYPTVWFKTKEIAKAFGDHIIDLADKQGGQPQEEQQSAEHIDWQE